MPDPLPEYQALINPLRATAAALGYAIGIHGSLTRDMDLIACPWTTDTAPPRVLAETLREIVQEITGAAYWSWHPTYDPEYTLNGAPGAKPHGRLGWIINLNEHLYIDLSVMPPYTNWRE